jgi:hypothetical protein
VFWEERGEFFLRRYDDQELAKTDWSDRFMGDDSHPEALLFRNIHLGSNGHLKSSLQIAMLKTFIENSSGHRFAFSDTGPHFNDSVLHIGYAPLATMLTKEYVAMNQAERNVDMVNALRSHVVRILQWPVFIQGAINGRARAIERFSKGPQVPPCTLPFDAVEELDEFLDVMKEKFPSYWGSNWDDIWANQGPAVYNE